MKILSKKRKIAIFLSLLIILIVTVVVVTSMQNKVLGDAEIIVYTKGKRIVLDSKSPYFRELQKACEGMLNPVDPFSGTPDAYLLLPNIKFFFGNSFPAIEKIKNEEFAIEIIYRKPVKTVITLGAVPTMASTYEIILYRFVIPLTGDLTHVSRIWNDGIFTYTFFFLSSNLEKPIVATTRTPQKIKNILTHKFNIPIPN